MFVPIDSTQTRTKFSDILNESKHSADCYLQVRLPARSCI